MKARAVGVFYNVMIIVNWEFNYEWKIAHSEKFALRKLSYYSYFLLFNYS